LTETKIIPIFPLDLVLFPRQELPLRIFEPRYKQLVDDCMIGDGQFGVCLIDESDSINGWNSPKLVGTIAKISKCEDVMYIQAEVEMIPEIDENISLEKWEALVELWKKKIIKQALPQTVDSHSLDHVLEQYYLNTDTPTVDYIYSLSAIGAKDPNELQPILEATTMDELIKRVEELLAV